MNSPSDHLTIGLSILARAPELIVLTQIVSGVKVGKISAALQAEKDTILKNWNGKTKNDLNAMPMIVSYRALHAELQSKRDDNFLPAVEGMLVRAILKGKFPAINSVVDAGNVASLTYLVPMGLFDADKVKGKPVLELAGPGDTMIAIGKESPMAVPEGAPILRDSEKIVSLIGVRDSKDTMITPRTENVFIFTWALGEEHRPLLKKALEECCSRLAGG